MLTLDGAGALLLVCLGLCLLVVSCCAALIFARTRLAPHADCKRELSQMEGTLENVVAWQKKHQKAKAGAAPPRTGPSTIPERSLAEVPRLTDEELEAKAGSHLMELMRGGGNGV